MKASSYTRVVDALSRKEGKGNIVEFNAELAAVSEIKPQWIEGLLKQIKDDNSNTEDHSISTTIYLSTKASSDTKVEL